MKPGMDKPENLDPALVKEVNEACTRYFDQLLKAPSVHPKDIEAFVKKLREATDDVKAPLMMTPRPPSS